MVSSAEPKPLDVRRCARLHTRAESERRALVFVVENRCDAPIRCSLKWTTRCNAEKQAHTDDAVVAPKDKTELDAPSGCTDEQTWEVGSMSWQCGPK